MVSEPAPSAGLLFMRTNPKHVIALVTAPDLKQARSLAQAALSARLVACVNLVPRIESHYWWRGRIETSRETLLILKTIGTRLRALEDLILAKHPYDTPEFIVLPITRGNKRYLSWLDGGVAKKASDRPARRSV